MLLGKTVHYYPAGDQVCKAAIVVKKWSQEMVNLTIFAPLTSPGETEEPIETHTSVAQGKGEDHWHFEEDCPFAHAL